MALIYNESLAQGTKPDQNQNSLLVIRQFDKLLPGAVTGGGGLVPGVPQSSVLMTK